MSEIVGYLSVGLHNRAAFGISNSSRRPFEGFGQNRMWIPSKSLRRLASWLAGGLLLARFRRMTNFQVQDLP